MFDRLPSAPAPSDPVASGLGASGLGASGLGASEPVASGHRSRRGRSPGLAALAAAIMAISAGLTAIDAVAAPPDDSSDEYGYLNTAARCDDDQTLMAFGRTSRAMVAVCVDSDGELEYRGVRLSDQAATTLSATRASDGSIIATNDGVTYAISPTFFLVSEGDSVLYRDAWIEFRQPRFSGAPTTTPAPSTSSTPSTSSSPSTSSTPPTVSTTTVPMAPVPPAGR